MGDKLTVKGVLALNGLPAIQDLIGKIFSIDENAAEIKGVTIEHWEYATNLVITLATFGKHTTDPYTGKALLRPTYSPDRIEIRIDSENGKILDEIEEFEILSKTEDDKEDEV